MITKDDDGKIKLEKATKCAMCDSVPMFDGCSVGMVAVSESGQVLDSFTTKDSSMSVMLPLCCYHVVLAQEGLVLVDSQNHILSHKMLSDMEHLSNSALKSLSLSLRRLPVHSLNIVQIKAQRQIIKILLDARNFQEKMSKDVERS